MKERSFLSYVIAMLVSLLASVALVFLFAIVISNASVSSTLIKPVNGVIKAVAAAIGAFISVKGEKSTLKGLLFGLAYCLFSYLLFCAIGGKFDIGLQSLFDILICVTAGGAVGAIKAFRR